MCTGVYGIAPILNLVQAPLWTKYIKKAFGLHIHIPTRLAFPV